MASPAPPFPDAPPTGPCPDALSTPPCHGAPPAVEAQATLTEEILLRLPTGADLAHASMAGPSLRRTIAGHSFLHRFHTLHSPPLVGILLPTSFLPVEPPHPSAAAERPLADTDFSCSFLTSRERPWIRHDFREGRALLCIDRHDLSMFRDIAVCDPLHRRYLLPLVPPCVCMPDLVDHYEAFRAPAGGDEGTDIAADAAFRFRVMCLAKYQTQLVICSFSSSGTRAGQWHTVTFDGWSTLVAGISDGDDAGSSIDFQNRYYAHGCFCWPIPRIGKLLMLDMGTMEFSSVNILHSPQNNCQMAIVEAREGRLGLFTLSFNLENYAYYLWYTILRSNGEGTMQWLTADRLTLPHDDYHFKILGVVGGCLLLQAFTKQMWWIPSFLRPKFEPYCFSLDLQTMKLEPFCGVRAILSSVDLYAGFPPPLSPPTI